MIRKANLIGMIIAVIGIVIVGAFVALEYYGDYDFFNNGAVDVNELTDEQIVEMSSKYKAYFTKWVCQGKGSGVNEVDYIDDTDCREVFFSAKFIKGINTVSSTRAEDCTVNLQIDSSISKGNARVVVIMDDEIIEEFNAGENKNFSYTVEGEHFIYVKILCEDAAIEIKTVREFK